MHGRGGMGGGSYYIIGIWEQFTGVSRFGGWFMFVRYSHRRRSIVGKHRPQLAVVAVRHSLSSLLTTHAHRCPHAFGWTLGEGPYGQMYPMPCLIIVIVVVHHPSSTSSVSVVNRPLCPPSRRLPICHFSSSSLLPTPARMVDCCFY